MTKYRMANRVKIPTLNVPNEHSIFAVDTDNIDKSKVLNRYLDNNTKYTLSQVIVTFLQHHRSFF